jgi:L-ascorbate metabolism protein UlaG (beta-lactamase superfamily)
VFSTDDLDLGISHLDPTRAGASVRVRWLGTAGFEITFETTTILIDPYLTRASLPRLVAGKLEPNTKLLRSHLPKADAIIAGHTHFDHALDIPFLARSTGAMVFGSRSAITLCRGSSVPEAQLVDVERSPGSDPVVQEVGPFRLRFLPSAHSPLLLGRVPFPGEIVDCSDIPMRAERYRCGAVFGIEIEVAGRRIYHLGSAEILDASMPQKEVDLALVCVAGWTTTPRFPERVAKALSPRAVLLSHWDDFFRPLDAPVRRLPAMKILHLADRLHASLGQGVRVGTVPLLGHLDL